MTEKLLQFIWQHGYYNRSNLRTTTGEPVAVIHGGNPNENQGPDFLEARIRVGQTLLAGSVELHLQTSGWKRHGHSSDPNYGNVILHVVYEHDEPSGILPVLELGARISHMLCEQYDMLMQGSGSFPCAHQAKGVRSLVWAAWLDRLLVERLTHKAAYILALHQKSQCNWEETFWWLLARSFGGRINGDAFEQMAVSIPTSLLHKHKSSIHQLEALLFGQTNLLAGQKEDSYARLLQKEYNFLRKKYGLTSILFPVHFLRMRPSNFPSVRLAQLAALVHHSEHLFSRLIEADRVESARKLLSATANDFWLYRYRFDEPSNYKPKVIGVDMTNRLIINTVVPLLFAYGAYRREDWYKTKAMTWLEKTTAEKNRITAMYLSAGLQNRNASDSQAYVELKKGYCDEKRCLHCAIGNALFKPEKPGMSS